MSEKAFPKPRESGGAYRKIATPLPKIAPIAPAKATVVTRAEPPVEETDLDSPAPTQLSRDEIQAILAVNETNTMTGWGKSIDRFKVAVIPMGVGSTLAHMAFGYWGLGIVLASGIFWSLKPMLRQDREGWSAPDQTDDDHQQK